MTAPDLSAPPRPAVAPPADYTFPSARRARLDNGLEVLDYHVPGQYVPAIRLVVPLPLHREPRDAEGVATLMARALDEGTQRLSPTELARELERRGIAIAAGMSEAGLSVQVDVTSDRCPEALELMRQCLTEPSFPDAEVERLVTSTLVEIAQERATAASRAASEFLATYFDPTSRSSRRNGGTEESVRRLRREDLAAFHAQHVAPTEATLVLAGDLAGADGIAMVSEVMSGWTASSGHTPAGTPSPAVLAADRARIVVVDRPGSVQSEFAVGCPGPDRSVDGGWAPYPVLGFVMGGSPTSRLDAVLREAKGYTYGIRSVFRPRRAGGLFMTGGSVRADVTADALAELLDILDAGRDGFSDAEIRRGVDFIAKTAPGRYATADAIADEAAAMAFDGRSTQFTTAMLQDMRSVDGARATEAYRRFVDGRWTVVVVGEAAGFVDRLEALGRGPVTVVPV